MPLGDPAQQLSLEVARLNPRVESQRQLKVDRSAGPAAPRLHDPRHPRHGCGNLVRAQREGRTIVYSLRDDHVAIMLNEAIYHIEHLREEPSASS